MTQSSTATGYSIVQSRLRRITGCQERGRTAFYPHLELLEDRLAPSVLLQNADPIVNTSSTQRGNQAETTLAVNPSNTAEAFVASNAFTTGALGSGIFAAFTTTNRGGAKAQWKQTTLGQGIPGKADGLPAAYTDPNAVFDGNNNLYLVYLSNLYLWKGQVQKAIGNNGFSVDANTTDWAPHQWDNAYVLLSRPGAGELAKVTESKANSITVSKNWTNNPAADTTFWILAAGTGGTQADGESRTIEVAKSTDGGAKFTWVGRLDSGQGLDYPSLGTGPRDKDGGTSVWFAWADSLRGVSAKGAKIGATVEWGDKQPVFTSPDKFTEGGHPHIAVGPEGQVAVAFNRIFNGQALKFTRSIVSVDGDGFGPAGFENTKTIDNIEVVGLHKIAPQPNRGIGVQPKLGWFLDGGNKDKGKNNKLYVVYDHRDTTTGDVDVFFASSTDAGKNWSPLSRVDDNNGSGFQFNSAIAVDQTTGKVAFTWYDNRNAGMTPGRVQLFGAISVDGKKTLENEVISAINEFSTATRANSNDWGFAAGKGQNSTKTLLDISGQNWVADQWAGFTIETEDGKFKMLRGLITDTCANSATLNP